MNRLWIVVPVKPLAQSKQRLAAILEAHEREQLVLTMLRDVLTSVCSVSAIDGVLLVSRSLRARDLGREFGAEIFADSTGSDHSLALTEASRYLTDRHGAIDILALPADVPLVTDNDINQIIAYRDQITLVPNRAGEGTNAILVTQPGGFGFQFGKGSLEKHVASARAIGKSPLIVRNPNLEFDLDEPADLVRMLQKSPVSFTRDYLEKSGIAMRSAVPDDNAALSLAGCTDTRALTDEAAKLRDAGHRNVVTYSRKVFIPLTQLCRDVCHYCTFARTPKRLEAPYLSLERVLEIARHGAALGCKEALFTLGEKPELRYRAARDALRAMGYSSTLEYLRDAAMVVYQETGLLPHLNPGTMTAEEVAALRPVAPSMGLMLECVSPRLMAKGMPHHGSPDKLPELRLRTIEEAGRAKVPLTTGILIGIGESRRERIESLLALRDLHSEYGHLQEIIIQNFRAKANTRMSGAPEPDLDELLWTIAVARIVFGTTMNIQAPPNLSPGALPQLIGAGINDWGGVSPLTPDFVNPEAPWPHLEDLRGETERAGKHLQERLTIYPEYARRAGAWTDAGWHTPLVRMIDSHGFARIDAWAPGADRRLPAGLQKRAFRTGGNESSEVRDIVTKAGQGEGLTVTEIVRLFRAHGDDLDLVVHRADELRRQVNGDTVTYVVNRNINYTNVCRYHCRFCAFSKGKATEHLRGAPYDLSLDEIRRRAHEAWDRGATEVCMQGGIHPGYTGDTYLEILGAVKDTVPAIHVHAFSPLEVWQGAATLGMELPGYLQRLAASGLGSLPGTAAEILDDEVRDIICPDKITTDQWLEVMETAHTLGIRSTATIMFGHIDGPINWARHLLRIRDLQSRTGGFTEFVPLPFVHMESPVYLRGTARPGPTWRESLLMHAVARLVLHPWIQNIQASWVKLGHPGTVACLNAGCNDLGGTLMNESISRAAGASHGQELPVAKMNELIAAAGRIPRQRDTCYRDVSQERTRAAVEAPPLEAKCDTPIRGGAFKRSPQQRPAAVDRYQIQTEQSCKSG